MGTNVTSRISCVIRRIYQSLFQTPHLSAFAAILLLVLQHPCRVDPYGILIGAMKSSCLHIILICRSNRAIDDPSARHAQSGVLFCHGGEMFIITLVSEVVSSNLSLLYLDTVSQSSICLFILLLSFVFYFRNKLRKRTCISIYHIFKTNFQIVIEIFDVFFFYVFVF